MGTIAQELERIQQAKADIITSLVNKGATVPQDALIDDLPDIIDDLPSGGGGSNNYMTPIIMSMDGTTNLQFNESEDKNVIGGDLSDIFSTLSDMGNFSGQINVDGSGSFSVEDECFMGNDAVNTISSPLPFDAGVNSFKNSAIMDISSAPLHVAEHNSFENCYNLSPPIQFYGDAVIGSEAFKGCSGLEYLMLDSTYLESLSIASDAFDSTIVQDVQIMTFDPTIYDIIYNALPAWMQALVSTEPPSGSGQE